MTKPAYTTPDPSLENEWSDVLPASPPSPTPMEGQRSQLPSATTRTSGLRPSVPQPPPPSARLPAPGRLPVVHPADEGNDRTIQRNVSFAQLDFEDADRTTELAADQMSRLAATTFPSDAPPPQRPTLPVPASLAPLPPQAFPSLSEMASQVRPFPAVHQAAQALDMGHAMVGAVEAQLRVQNRPMPWVATPPLPRNDQRLVTALIVVGAFVFTAAIALGAALWILHR